MVFNHLEITVEIHETMTSKMVGLFKETAERNEIPMTVEFNGHKYKVTMPESKVRIVGFTVEPKSVPHGVACQGMAAETGAHEIAGGQVASVGAPITFSYAITIVHS